jgi:hypothetical protein
MKRTRLTVLIGALTLVASFVVFQAAEPARATGAEAAGKQSDGGIAAQAIEKAAAAARISEPVAWKSPILKDSLLDLLAAAKAAVINGHNSEDDEEANRIFDAAAWTLDIAVHRVDGEAGESADAHLDDWVTSPEVTTTLHGLLVQARSEVFRSKR